MIEDQSFILEQILQIVSQEAPDGVLIAGDVYDKSVPPGEAVTLLDGFLYRLSRMGIPTMVISGNHDSPERCWGPGSMWHRCIRDRWSR